MPWNVEDVDEFNENLSQSDKEKWVEVANSALESCLADGGSESECEANAIRQANSVVANIQTDEYITDYSLTANNYNLRHDIYDGKEYLVIPVVMMTEGVHSGSHGPIYHTPEELGKMVDSWNRMPVTLNHPRRDGSFVSANSPAVLEEYKVGEVFNTKFEDNKLKAEAWIDEEKISNVDPDALQAIQDRTPMDVSVGIFSDEEQIDDSWNGEQYQAIARNYRPDHLALLPNAEGACSWSDGCGVRANSKQKEKGDIMAGILNKLAGIFDKFKPEVQDNSDEDTPKEDTDTDSFSADKEFLKELNKQGISLELNQEEGYSEILDLIQSKLDSMDTNSKIHYIEEVYDDYFVYHVRDQMNDESGYYRLDYSLDSETDEVTFGDNPQKVAKEVEYNVIEDNVNTNKGKEPSMADKTKKACPDVVDNLIDSEFTTFEQDDKEWLSELSEVQINKLQETVAKKEDNDNKDDEPMTQKKAINALKESFKKPEEFFDLMPNEVSEQLKHGLNLHKERKQQYIDNVTANTDVYEEDELKEMNFAELEKLSKAVGKKNDYSAMGVGSYEKPKNEDGPTPLAEYMNDGKE